MKNGLSEIVHIIPLGCEFDRAVRPFDTAAANRVCIIADREQEEYSNNPQMYLAETCPPPEYYLSRVLKHLRKKHIPAEIIRTDFSDMGELLKTISALIRKEQTLGNKVYINMSAAGELAAAAASLAGTALDAEVYCVHADGYASDKERPDTGISVCSTSSVSMLPKVDIRLPDETELPVLEELYYSENNVLSASEISGVVEGENDYAEGPGISMMKCDCSAPCVGYEHPAYDNIPSYAASEPGSDAERWNKRKVQSRNLMKVSGMMKRMEEKGYVTKAKYGRKMMYQLTERGLYALILSGAVE
ncbi:MAG TPA: DUF6293 family protein [Methanocorpusculum sp.]|nr:DUF6293 family protein [Methanocorpusculum sp.]